MGHVPIRLPRARSGTRSRLGAALTAAGAAALGVGLLLPTGQSASAQTFTGQASAIYIQDLTLLGSPASGLDGGLGICDTGPLSQSAPSGQTQATGLICNVSTGTNLSPLASVSLLTNYVNTSGSPTSSTAFSQLASVAVLQGQAPGGVDVVDATLLTAQAGANCTGPGTASSSVATLSIAGTPVIGPGGLLDLSSPDTAPSNDANPTLSLGLANVYINYQQYNAATNTETVSPVVVEFPANGPLAALITGRIYLSYAQADLACGAPAPSPTPSGTATPTPSGTATPTPSASATPTPKPTRTPKPSPSPSPSCSPPVNAPGHSVEECHEALPAQCFEHEPWDQGVPSPSGCPVHPPIKNAGTPVGPQRSDYLATAGATLMIAGIFWMRWEVRRRRKTA